MGDGGLQCIRCGTFSGSHAGVYAVDRVPDAISRLYQNYSYSGGQAWYYAGGYWNGFSGGDMLFRTYVETIPEPEAIGALVAAVVLLVFGRIRRGWTRG